MVHALQEIHNLLKSDGYLIDIRPDGELNKFIRPHQDGEHFIGHMHETDDYIEYRQAEASVQEVVAAGLFQIEKAEAFEFRIHADSFAELKTHLDETWSDLLIKEDVIAEANWLDETYGVGKVFLREQARILLLRPCRPR